VITNHENIFLQSIYIFLLHFLLNISGNVSIVAFSHQDQSS